MNRYPLMALGAAVKDGPGSVWAGIGSVPYLPIGEALRRCEDKTRREMERLGNPAEKLAEYIKRTL